ncbi:MAG: twin-arginine translocase TatA/TatE family subunit [Chloroflexi bacterium]|nr:twin-arginine translocase TatA/TatE family subunit [Chloroflexota bacterium]
MEILNVGPLEIMVIIAVAFIVLGPERATELGRDLGRAVTSLRRNFNVVQQEVTRQWTEVERPVREIQEKDLSLPKDKPSLSQDDEGARKE